MAAKALLAVFMLLMISACEDRRKTACAEMSETKDPARKAELEKFCPRGGPKFKPSKPREW